MTDAEKLAACERQMQELGDKVADMFEQMVKGNWTDDHGHRVEMNRAMVNLRNQMIVLMSFRTTVLGYSPV